MLLLCTFDTLKKKIPYTIFFLFSLALGINSVSGQGIELNRLYNWKIKTIIPASDSIKLDSLGIIPQSIIMVDLNSREILDTSFYEINIFSSILVFKKPLDSIRISYRTFPFSFNSNTQNKKPENFLKKDSLIELYFPYIPISKAPEFLDFDGLKYSGNFSRGINFGSNQDLVVNSAFDLQLSGKLSNGIEVLAALTDNNIPIQPEGNTQQLQNFDKIFIQVKKDNHLLIGGDYDLNSTNSYFLKFNKQLQGLAYKGAYQIKDNLALKSKFGFAVAKGKFNRNTFVGQENNQGPYRLTGANGESFLIILSGSEKIFVDGKLLTRGEEADYIIDYNTGELIFTPNFLITKDSRINADFQYADRNYFRSILYTGQEGSWKKLKFNLDVYSEQDSKNKPILQNINDSVVNILEQIGNNLDEAFISGANQSIYDPLKVQYQLKDTTVAGILYDSIFIYSTDSSLAKYNLSFSFVGMGKGNYEPTRNALNQRVYSWLAPSNGILSGSYEPIIEIITPKKDQYITAGLSYEINKKLNIEGNFGVSNRDKNTFSEIGNNENLGFASQGSIFHQSIIGKDSSVNIATKIHYEFKQNTFSPLEPYRPVEFTRDWNIEKNDSIDEHLFFLQSIIQSKKGWLARIESSTFQKPNFYRGYKNILGADYYKNGWVAKVNMNILQATSNNYKNVFLRPNYFLSKEIKWLKGFIIGTEFFQERNAIKSIFTDSLLPTSYFNNNLRNFIQTSDSGFIQLAMDYKYRNDLFSNGINFKKASIGHTFDFRGRFLKLKNQELNWSFTLRNLNILDTTLIQNKSEKTYLGRGEYGVRLKKGLFRYNVIYELGSGQERIKEFSFLEVPSGQGVFKWVDENSDGIKQQNEFVPSEFQDSAQYVKIFTTLNEYIKARKVGFNQIISLQPKAIWSELDGIKGFLSKIQLQSFFEARLNTLDGAQKSPFNPFVFNTNDTSIIGANFSTRNNFLFNPNDSKFSFTYTWQTSKDKTLLVNGFDIRKRNLHSLNSRIGINSSFSSLINLSVGNDFYQSEFFIQNRYNIKSYKIDPSLVYNYKTALRIAIGYGFLWKKNAPELGNEKNLANKMNFELRYSKGGKQTIESKFIFANINYQGIAGTTKAYLILEGLQQGKNYIWNLDYNRQISKNLLLNLGYEGRKTGTAKIVNTGKASIRAIF